MRSQQALKAGRHQPLRHAHRAGADFVQERERCWRDGGEDEAQAPHVAAKR